MRVLILGATGFLGRNLTERFSKRNDCEVHAVDHIRPCYDIEGVTWHCMDLRQEQSFEGYDVVIQAAATTSGSKDIVNNPSIHICDNTVMNALVFREAVRAKVKHLIFFSCSTMFSDGHVTEESPIDIHDKYFGVAHMKLYNEKMCDFYSRIGETKFTAIRHSNCFGPWDKYDLEKSHFVGATITKVMTVYDKITIWGTGEESRDLLYISDLCDFVETVIEKQQDKFQLYNAGSGIAHKVKDVVRKIIAASGERLVIEHDLNAPTIPTSLSLDCAKAKNDLGWEPKIGLEEGINLTLGWYRNNVL